MNRIAQGRISQVFLDRWSPRAFDASALPQEDLETMLEAARWAPSAFNYQPWRFVYAHRDSADWPRFLELLIPFNRSWAQNASALLFVLSERFMGSPDKPSHSHSFDAGAAWGFLALQAHELGYHTHGMSGIEFARAAEVLAVPEDMRVEAAIAIGRLGDPESLPDSLRAREKPSDRKPLSQIAFEGRLPG